MNSITISEVAKTLKNKNGILQCINQDDELYCPVTFKGVKADGDNLILLNTHEIFGEDNIVKFDTEGNTFHLDDNGNYCISVGDYKFEIEIM